MEIGYGINIDKDVVASNLSRILGQVFSLLPKREEGEDWVKPLETLLTELSGMSSLIPDQEGLFQLVCKLEGLRLGGEDIEFPRFRRTIFEACSIVSKLKDNVS